MLTLSDWTTVVLVLTLALVAALCASQDIIHPR